MTSRDDSVYLPNFSGVRVLVVGDLLVDSYVYCHAKRISREAPVLINDKVKEEKVPGGAANVAANLRVMGCDNVYVLGTLDKSPDGAFLSSFFLDNYIHATEITGGVGVKQRVMVGSATTPFHQIIRLDTHAYPVSPQRREELNSSFVDIIDKKKIDIVIISDYTEGVIEGTTLDYINTELRVPFIVDSRNGLINFKLAHTLTPNVDEFNSLYPTTEDSEVATKLLQDTQSEYILFKQGNKGATLYSMMEGISPIKIPPYEIDNLSVLDGTGAGDAAVAAYALGVASEMPVESSAALACVAGGIKVTKRGTATVNYEELAHNFSIYMTR